ncbi:hypothetical protein [Streptomyces jumonjinensis]|uniref:hypothetical protein n=1 Tax=Streptomyces jumonjinensis TaxID=1945 RepID=UPI0037B6B866
MWLTLLALGLMYAHGIGGENSAHHLSSAAFSSIDSGHSPTGSGRIGNPGDFSAGGFSVDGFGPATAADPALRSAPGAHEGHHRGGSAHPVEQCMPQQPQLTVTQQVPGSDGLGQSDARGRADQRPERSDARDATSAPACPRATGILRT